MNILTEQLDQADLQNIARAFEKIDAILGDVDKKLPSIDDPIEKARQSLANMLSGEGGILKRMFRGVTGQQQKTISNVMEAQIQLVSLFRALPSIMTIAGKGIKKGIAQAPTGDQRAVRTGEPFDPTGHEASIFKKNTVEDAIMSTPQGPAAVRNLKNLIAKALKPAKIGTTPINPKLAAQELLELSPDEFSDLAKRAGGAQLRMPVPKEDFTAIQDKAEDYESKEGGGRAQQMISDLTKGDKDRAKAMKALIDQLSGLTSQDVKLVKKGLDKFLGNEEQFALGDLERRYGPTGE